MPSLQDELKIVEQRETDFYKNHPRLTSLDNAISNSGGVVFFGGIVSVFLVTVIVRWIFYHFPTWSELFIIAVLSYIPGFIIPAIFEGFLSRKYQQYLFKKYRIGRITYEALLKQKTELRTQKRDLEVKIKKLKEYNLKYNLNDFIEDLKGGKFNYHDAKNYQQTLEEEYKVIRKNGFFYHTSRYYSNRFLTIDSMIQNLLLKETSTILEKSSIATLPIESKPHTSVENKEEKEVQVSKPAEEKKSASDIKIIPSTNSAVTISGNLKEKQIPNEEEKNPSDLFSKSNTEYVIKPESPKSNQIKTPVKIDFPKLNEHRHNIGELGEQYIFEKEQNYFISQGKIKQSREVIHVSINSDSEGYDIISFTDTDERKYIEVKTTTSNEFEPFYLSSSEMEAMNRLSNYWIYRVYNFNIGLKKGDLYKIDCKKDLGSYYNIQASSFKVTPKK